MPDRYRDQRWLLDDFARLRAVCNAARRGSLRFGIFRCRGRATLLSHRLNEPRVSEAAGAETDRQRKQAVCATLESTRKTSSPAFPAGTPPVAPIFSWGASPNFLIASNGRRHGRQISLVSTEPGSVERGIRLPRQRAHVRHVYRVLRVVTDFSGNRFSRCKAGGNSVPDAYGRRLPRVLESSPNLPRFHLFMVSLRNMARGLASGSIPVVVSSRGAGKRRRRGLGL